MVTSQAKAGRLPQSPAQIDTMYFCPGNPVNHGK
jgi:hypothetical protein